MMKKLRLISVLISIPLLMVAAWWGGIVQKRTRQLDIPKVMRDSRNEKGGLEAGVWEMSRQGDVIDIVLCITILQSEEVYIEYPYTRVFFDFRNREGVLVGDTVQIMRFPFKFVMGGEPIFWGLFDRPCNSHRARFRMEVPKQAVSLSARIELTGVDTRAICLPSKPNEE
jgi:hypothetical protein